VSDVQCVIGGKLVAGDRRGEVRNPASTADIVGTFPLLGAADVDAAVAAAAAALPGWSATPAVERARLLAGAGPVLMGLDLIPSLVAEQGKVYWEAFAEVAFYDMAVNLYQPMAEALDAGELLVDDESGRIRLTRRPVGVVAAFTAWNWPFALSAGKVVPALIAGNTVVLKPSPVDPLSTLRAMAALAELLPPGVVNVVTGDDETVSARLMAHPLVRMTTFTGGTGAGRYAAEAAAPSFKRTVLELGGNDAALLLDDAVIDTTLCQRLTQAAFVTSGQVCIALKRVYAPADRVAELAEGMAAVLDGTCVVGNGLESGITMGPVTTERQRDRVAGLIAAAADAGGTVRACGRLAADPSAGYFLQPHLVTGLDEKHPVVAEEQFGPVLPIQPYTSLEEGIGLVNDTDCGLTASVWTADEARGFEVAERLEAGAAFVNIHGLMAVNPLAPMGGVKTSGLGREYGLLGLQAYTEPKVLSNWKSPMA
jgi:acyl-CoA reductase-like NAD-dependent aldehyde dehydrogenase